MEIRLFPKKGRPQGNIVDMEIRLFPKKGRPQGNIVETEIRLFPKKINSNLGEIREP